MSKQDAFWVLQAQCGDRQAMDRLLQSIGPVLIRYLGRYLGKQGSAEDVAQEAMLVLCRKLKELRNPELLRPWAFRIASRLALKVLQETNRLQPLDYGSESLWIDPGAEQRVTQQLEEYSVAHLVRTLPPAARASVWLHYVEEFSIAEVAEVLDISPGTAKSRVSYGLKKLRELLESTERI